MTFPCAKYGRIHLGVTCLDCALVEQVEARVGGLRLDNLREGYGQGLDASRDAVDKTGIGFGSSAHGRGWNDARTAALAAIDALRGDPVT